MNFLIRRKYICVLALIVLATVFEIAIAEQAIVGEITAQTSEKLVFRIWPDSQTFKFGHNVVIRYKVENRATRSYYLVHENPPDIVVEQSTVTVGAPLPIPMEHGRYNFSFTKIGGGKSYEGSFVIPATMLNEIRQWRFRVGFGYVDDITGLDRKLKPDEAPIILKAPLNERLKSLQLGALVVEIVKP